MDKRPIKYSFLIAGSAVALIFGYFAYSRPAYFTNQTYLAGLLFLEILAAAVWSYRRTFFALLSVTFLFAGVNLPFGSSWSTARWIVLGMGALVGIVITLKEGRYQFGGLHLLAFFSVLAAFTSAAVSHHTFVSSLKVLSLLLLFLYAATGARLAVVNREGRFFAGLLTGCELFVVAIAMFYFLGREVMGNPNSLGAVMGVVAAPMLLWGTMLPQEPFAHRRRVLLCVVSMYLAYTSHARAGILAALVSCALLCLATRKYALLLRGVGVLAVVVATGAILNPEAFSRTISSFTSTVVYKEKDPTLGLLGSRETPWQETMDAIRNNFWFGTGFGTSDTRSDAIDSHDTVASSTPATTEHGSSYLEIVSWVGVLGTLPFLLLLVVLLQRACSVILWTYRTPAVYNPALPLALLVIGGLIHAAFEDWLFAPGYYLCVFYWSIAFIFFDQAALLPAGDAKSLFARRAAPMPRDFGAVAPSR